MIDDIFNICRECRHWPVASWGRVEVVHYAFSFLVSFAHSCDRVQPALCSHAMFAQWLKRMTLEAPELWMMMELFGCKY